MTAATEQAINLVRDLSEEEKFEVVKTLRKELEEAWEQVDQELWDLEGIQEAERRYEQDKDNPEVWEDWSVVYKETKARLKARQEEVNP